MDDVDDDVTVPVHVVEELGVDVGGDEAVPLLLRVAEELLVRERVAELLDEPVAVIGGVADMDEVPLRVCDLDARASRRERQGSATGDMVGTYSCPLSFLPQQTTTPMDDMEQVLADEAPSEERAT